ncbi:hypothetical protein V6N13_125566 [Hibiscus sabdariffa]|uniref:BHLH domain-containing protein n=1 Tax=Hibiscus sabdariffa TaxID=183260 RepID=A0ABR2U685_9ROSI
MDDSLCELFEEAEFGPGGGDNLFSFFESFDGIPEFSPFTPLDGTAAAIFWKDGEETTTLVTQKSTSSSAQHDSSEPETLPKSKKPKLASSEETNPDGQQRMSHITVERNRRKQMNEHISVLRSLMPCFYVKRGDQASILGGVVDYINELQQVLQSLEAKKQRKVMSEVLSPRVVSSPRPSPLSLSPRKPPLSPRIINLPISPRTPQPGSPYKPRLHQGYLSPTMPTASLEPSPTSSTSSVDNVHELVANAKSPIADVEVKFSGPNLILKTVSPPIPGQAVKIISTLEDLSLEILNVNINTIDDTMLNSFTIKKNSPTKSSKHSANQQSIPRDIATFNLHVFLSDLLVASYLL